MSPIRSSLLLGAGDAAGGFQVSRSLRFNSADSAYLNRTPSVAGNRKTWTWSGWVKRANFSGGTGPGDHLALFGAYAGTYDDSGYFDVLWQTGTNKLLVGFLNFGIVTTAVFRDVSAWYHIVIAVDTTQATLNNRVKAYVNGVDQGLSVDAGVTQNLDTAINHTGSHTIGKDGASAFYYLSGYLANIHFIDGQALTPSSFTEVSATTGQLIPKAYSGGSYGTNGFYLQFADNSSNTAATLGKDTSSNGNNWTPNNFSVTDAVPVTVAAATGALPILNTTDTYGATLGSGVRSDAFASSLQFCIPGGTSAGLNLTDQNPSGRVSPLRNLSGASLVNDTSTSKFYGGSLSVPLSVTGTYSNDVWSSIGSGPFTVEMWLYLVDSTMSNGYGYNVLVGRKAYDGYVNIGLAFGGVAGRPGARMFCVPNPTQYVEHYLTENGAAGPFPVGQWVHCAQTRDSGGTVRTFKNGIKVAETTGITDALVINYPEFGGWTTGYGYPIEFKVSDMRVYTTAKYTSSFSIPVSPQQIAPGNAGNDSLVDTPTSYGTDTGVGNEVRGNYCTLNPLDKGSDVNTVTNGNLEATWSGVNGHSIRATIAVRSGKWYWEATGFNALSAGIIAISQPIVPSGGSLFPGGSGFGAGNSYGYYASNGSKATNGTVTAYGASYGTSDVVGIALDLDNGTLTFYKNGATQGTAFTGISGTFAPAFGYQDAGTNNLVVNFGQRAFAYTAPSGFKALVDTNLPTPVVAKPNTLMDVALYTGNGGTQTISGLAFEPDFVWLKGRSVAYSHQLYDQVRGAGKLLNSNSTNAESTATDNLTAFTSAGFTLGNDAGTNQSSATYVAWAWDAGTSTVSNGSGSITSQVRANVSAGFSVVTYTGTGANATVGHGLGVAPGFIIIKNRSSATNWRVYHSALGNTKAIFLSTQGTSDTSSVYWNNTSPTSTVFSIGSDDGVNGNGNGIVSYCFAPVAGYSSFGSYVGNGSSDGPMVWTGFRVRWLLWKRSDSGANSWVVIDAARNTYNVVNNELYANLSIAEGVFTWADFLSNGFKLRSADSAGNSSGATYIYAAFAESPFQYARAR